MFNFDREHENALLTLLDQLRVLLDLPSRGNVVEVAIRRLHNVAVSTANSRSEELQKALLLDFVLKPDGSKILTRWPLPLPVPCYMMAMFPAAVFDSPTGRSVRQKLFYALEKSFAGWSEREDVVTDNLDCDKSTVITVAPIKSLGQIYHAVGLFSDAAEGLIKPLIKKGKDDAIRS